MKQTYVYCSSCGSMTQPRSKIHWCYNRKGGVVVDISKKRWDPHLKCWVLDDPPLQDVREGNKYYNSVDNTWYDLDGVGEPGGFQTCEIPPKTEKQKEAEKEKHETKCTCFECRPQHVKYHVDSCSCHSCWIWKRGKGIETTSSWSNYKPYVPVKPFDGVDQKKWPNTYMFLVGMYYISQRWYDGKRIDDDDYRDRILHQKYEPEPKYPKVYTYGNYYGDSDYHNDTD